MFHQLKVAIVVAMLAVPSLSFACERLPIPVLAVLDVLASPCEDDVSVQKGMQSSQIRPL